MMRTFKAPSVLVALLLSSASQITVRGFAPLSSTAGSFQSSPMSSLTPRASWSTASLDLKSKNAKADSYDAVEEKRVPKNPTPVLVSALQDLAQRMKLDSPLSITPSTALAAAALAFTLTFSPLMADAAMSGGRMGGSFGSSSSSRQSYSRPAPSRSYYGGGGGGSSYYSRPSVTVAPIIGGGGGYYNPYYASPFASPFAAPRPMVYGGSPGVIAINRGPSLWDVLLVGGVAWVAWSAFTNTAERGAGMANDFWTENASSLLGSGTSVVQVTVALDVSNRDDPNSILSVLERLSQTSKTDSRMGIQSLTSQVALELLRRKSTIISGNTRYKHFRDVSKAQRDFNSLSVKERSKFEQEGTSKFGGVDYSGREQRSIGGGVASKATVAVVTLNLAIDGDSTKVPNINSIGDIEEALRKIAADVKVDDCLQSAEILWTPEDRTETLTFKDVIADYPELRSV